VIVRPFRRAAKIRHGPAKVPVPVLMPIAPS
jgi:hypothetical protein